MPQKQVKIVWNSRTIASVDQIMSYRPTHHPSLTFKEKWKIYMWRSCWKLQYKAQHQQMNIKKHLTTTHKPHMQTRTHKHTEWEKLGKAYKETVTFLGTEPSFLYQYFINRQFYKSRWRFSPWPHVPFQIYNTIVALLYKQILVAKFFGSQWIPIRFFVLWTNFLFFGLIFWLTKENLL